MHACSHFSRVQLCDPMDHNPLDSSVCGMSQASILDQVAFPSPDDLLNPGIEPVSLTSHVLAHEFFLLAPLGSLFTGST